MEKNILASAAALSDESLLERLDVLAGREREASVELVAHLAALDTRPRLYAAKGYGSLFSYCTQALRLSEDAACNRIEVARVCRAFPMVLELLAAGAMNLTSVRLIGPHLTPENHKVVLSKASQRTRRQIEALVAELAPRPDVATSVRKLPTFAPMSSLEPKPAEVTTPVVLGSAAPMSASPVVLVPTPRPIVQATAPARYRVQFTVGQETHDKLRRLQALLRREIPDGDPAAIIDRSLTLLLEKVERRKLGAAAKPRAARVIRPGTDNRARKADVRALPSRHIPRAVRRAVWRRDGGQCAFISADGRRCAELNYLELHHIHAFAMNGPSTVENISLRCRRHNQFEAELIFGPHGTSIVREERAAFRTSPPPQLDGASVTGH